MFRMYEQVPRKEYRRTSLLQKLRKSGTRKNRSAARRESTGRQNGNNVLVTWRHREKTTPSKSLSLTSSIHELDSSHDLHLCLLAHQFSLCISNLASPSHFSQCSSSVTVYSLTRCEKSSSSSSSHVPSGTICSALGTGTHGGVTYSTSTSCSATCECGRVGTSSGPDTVKSGAGRDPSSSRAVRRARRLLRGASFCSTSTPGFIGSVRFAEWSSFSARASRVPSVRAEASKNGGVAFVTGRHFLRRRPPQLFLVMEEL